MVHMFKDLCVDSTLFTMSWKWFLINIYKELMLESSLNHETFVEYFDNNLSQSLKKLTLDSILSHKALTNIYSS